MALSKCRWCLEPVAKNAKECSHCGALDPARLESWLKSFLALAFLLVIVFVVVFVVVRTMFD